MNIYILSCGVFEPELNYILNDIKNSNIFDVNINIKYLPFGLHTNLDKLKSVILSNLNKFNNDKIILLYGSKCHYMFHDFLKDYENIIRFEDSNCMELIINNDDNKITQDTSKLYITTGWVLKFDELNNYSKAVDLYDIRHQYGQYDSIIIGDTKVSDITDEMIFELFEKIQVPIEVEDVNINIFRNKIINAIKKAL